MKKLRLSSAVERLTLEEKESSGEIVARDNFLLRVSKAVERLRNQAITAGFHDYEFEIDIKLLNAEQDVKVMDVEEWRKRARRTFGRDPDYWAFICPQCGRRTTTYEWKHLGKEDAVAFTCIERYLEDGECRYTGGDPLSMNPVVVKMENGEYVRVFEFAKS